MSEPVSIVLVAVGGYGGTYVSALLDAPAPSGHVLVGVVDPFADRCRRINELRALGLPFYDTLDAFYADHTADLAVISSPIHLHTPQTCTALEHGSAVLCEKPLGATIQEMHRMIEARDAAESFVGIGYQWSFNPAIQALKQDIASGRLGRPRRLRTLVLWPRNDAYYGRNSWAGAVKDRSGNWILDSPVNNATAHYLHNMFYVLGSRVDRSAMPVSVQAEMYRANPISNYDTGIVRAITDTGVEILFYASHAIATTRGPEFVYEFEKATVFFSRELGGIVAEYADGQRREYGNPDLDVPRKLWDAIAATRGEKTIACGPEAAGAQTLCMNGMQESVRDIMDFPSELVCTEGDPGARLTFVRGLDEVLVQAYENGCLPSEMDVPWSRCGTTVDLRNYRHFPAADL